MSRAAVNAQFPFRMDDMDNRERMEASENPGATFEGNGVPPLHRIDLERITRVVRDGMHSPGYDRLVLMVGTVMPRLVREPRPGRKSSS